jgi:signal transduction histidine kinase
MQRSTHRMQALITDLLTLSRVDRQDAPFRRIQFSDVHSTVLEDLAMPIRETKASIELTGSCEFDADWAQMVQMMTNLVDNAIKYRHPERIPHIVISCQPKQAEWVEITVSDNGIGIKPEHYDKIFEIFQRLHNDAQYSGTGIGLAIVKRIVNRHRGSISVDSVPGTGTRFSIVLPQQQSN